MGEGGRVGGGGKEKDLVGEGGGVGAEGPHRLRDVQPVLPQADPVGKLCKLFKHIYGGFVRKKLQCTQRNL